MIIIYLTICILHGLLFLVNKKPLILDLTFQLLLITVHLVFDFDFMIPNLFEYNHLCPYTFIHSSLSGGYANTS